MIRHIASLCAILTCIHTATAEEVRKPVAVTSLETTDLADFNEQPEPIKTLIQDALKLTKLNLTYVFSSSDPKIGVMDCSGTIYHLLIKQGLKHTPCQSDEMGQWLQGNGKLKRTDKADSPTHAAFAALKPGDLIFWSRTYEATERRLPITHVMLYLGKHKITEKPMIFGASDRRFYGGQKRSGVSVFNLTMPKADGKVSIYGFGNVPGLVPAKSTSEPASLESTKPQSHQKEPKAE